MKAIASVAIAGMLAATSLTTTTVTADAGGKHWKHHNNNNYYNYNNHYSHGWNPGAALATGAILGLTFGALATPNYYYAPPRAYYYPPPPPPPAYPSYYAYSNGPAHVGSQHASWCFSRYRSYNVTYNTWVGFDGYVHQCVSPFSPY